jgi:hypothetical protein
VIRELTDRSFAFHKIMQIGHASFRIEVITEGNEGNPLAIQQASQGTLSVLAIFGLIHSYLRSVFPDAADKGLLSKPAIVFLDEIDEHLHPSWQQKIIGLLRRKFPNIQFIITAHSPLVVAGCLDREVAVLRKGENGFTVFQFQHDFIGWEPDEIYRRVFEVEEKDESYNHYNALYPKKDDIERQIKTLERKRELSEEETQELIRLRDNIYYSEKARGKQAERIEYKQLLRENQKLKKLLERLEAPNEDRIHSQMDKPAIRRKSPKSTKKKPKRKQTR